MIVLETCIAKCCLQHGIPQKCLEEKHETIKVANLNTTHKEVQMVISNECLKYKNIVSQCKSDCLNDSTSIKNARKDIDNVMTNRPDEIHSRSGNAKGDSSQVI